MKRKPNGFWVTNEVYQIKVWCVVKHLPTGVLELLFVVPNHQFGYTTQRNEKFQFLKVYEDKNEKRMYIKYHIHPRARMTSFCSWGFWSDWDVAQKFFVKYMQPIVTR